jgi:hypothetical protein
MFLTSGKVGRLELEKEEKSIKDELFKLLRNCYCQGQLELSFPGRPKELHRKETPSVLPIKRLCTFPSVPSPFELTFFTEEASTPTLLDNAVQLTKP